MNIGDKVVCVNDSRCRCAICIGLPVPVIKNNVYVVERISNAFSGRTTAIVLLGVPKVHEDLPDRGIGADRFRLLDELKQQAKQREERTNP